MKSVFLAGEFRFPYTDIKFPGQASDERILFVTREAPMMFYVRVLVVIVAGLVLLAAGFLTNNLFREFSLPAGFVMSVGVGSLILGLVFLLGGSWWVYVLWKKSLFILTNRRLTKFIYTTPWNRYNLSLGLDQVVDTGAYKKGYLQAMTDMGVFTARSSAGNRREKYFYIENVHAVEDLANYVNKLLHHFSHNLEKLDTFRPFLPYLKGEARKEYMKKYPQYWS